MPPLWPRTRPEIPDWPALRASLLAAAAERAWDLAVAAETAPPLVAWTDGPGPQTVVAATGAPRGWTFVVGDRVVDTPDGRVLVLDRTLSDDAIAVSLVRFYASMGRHWRSSEGPAYQEAWRALIGADDPAGSGYPIADTIARLLLAAQEPEGQACGPTRADVLSARLAAVGYEKLWALAYAAVP